MRMQPYAITMWDFSWLERRWAGAGFEDWDTALDELVERGYDAVRIDAYPHLASIAGEESHELYPRWSVYDWGAPMITRVRVLPALLDFIGDCAERDVKVGLSSWFRRDSRELWRELSTPRALANAWINTLRRIDDAGLLDAILFVDLCNEWPVRGWAPFLDGVDQNEVTELGVSPIKWHDDISLEWMSVSIGLVKDHFPTLPLTFSIHPFTGPIKKAASLDFLEPHIWMSSGEFFRRVGFTFGHRFDNSELQKVALHAERIFRSDQDHWTGVLTDLVHGAADWAKRLDKPLITTECWGITAYRDGPLFEWGWVKELCEAGTRAASETGMWAAIATSNFCSPQYVGMWRDAGWHRRLTDLIKTGHMPIAWHGITQASTDPGFGLGPTTSRAT